MRYDLETRYTLLERTPGVDGAADTIKRVPVTEAKYTSLVEDAKNSGQPEPEAEKVQTFKRPVIESIEDFLLLVPDPAEQVNIVQRTLDIKQTDAMRELMTNPGFQGVEGAFDLSDACAARSERKSASPIDKAAKVLDKLSTEDQAQLLQMLQARLTA